MFCELCGKDKRLIFHHLSYEPEILSSICYGCHKFLHNYSNFSIEQRSKIRNWIDMYSHLWVNGTEKNKKSNYRKIYQKEYSKTHRQELLEKQRIYVKENKDQIYAGYRLRYLKNKDGVNKRRKEQYALNKAKAIL